MIDRILEIITRFGYTLDDFTEKEIAQMEQELKDRDSGVFDSLDGILETLTYKEL